MSVKCIIQLLREAGFKPKSKEDMLALIHSNWFNLTECAPWICKFATTTFTSNLDTSASYNAKHGYETCGLYQHSSTLTVMNKTLAQIYEMVENQLFCLWETVYKNLYRKSSFTADNKYRLNNLQDL